MSGVEAILSRQIEVQHHGVVVAFLHEALCLSAVHYKIDSGTLGVKFPLKKDSGREVVLGDKNTHDCSRGGGLQQITKG
jgi:hypothetical protein